MGAPLRQRLETQCSGLPVNNASVSGDTSDGLVRLPDLLERHQPDTVVIELGGNVLAACCRSGWATT